MTPRDRMQDLLQEALRQSLRGNAATIPAGGHLFWRWFNDLNRTRTGNGYGPNPIGHAEIDAYAKLYRWPLEPRHVDMILAMDRVWLDHARSLVPGSRSASAEPAVDCTPEAFDAVFV